MAFSKKSNYLTKPKLMGRTVLYSSLDETELNALTIAMVLKEVLPIHFKNVEEIDYLIGYYKGNQDILRKTKKVRQDINNVVLENNAFHIVEFKKGYIFGDPIQYVQHGDIRRDEIDVLNMYMIENDKSSKDKDLAEDMYISGVGYRMVFPSNDNNRMFEIYNSEVKQTFVVYGSGIDKKKLFGAYIAPKKDYVKDEDYYVLTVYTKQEIYTFKVVEEGKEYKIDSLSAVETNWLRQIPIFEYPLNKSRLGIVELVKSVLDALNTISSNDIDDIEQFVNSLLIFVNAEINQEALAGLIELGAVNIQSNQDRGYQADIKLLTNKLQHTETKVLYDRLYNNMLTIAGVPKMTDKASSGDTGQARLVGEGWTMADERAKQDELSFKLAEKQMLRLVIDILKSKSSSGISSLNVRDIEIKFTRNKSDNLLVKTQGLLNLKQAQVSPDVAFQTVGLFSDASDVVQQAMRFYGDGFWKDDEVPNDMSALDQTVVTEIE